MARTRTNSITRSARSVRACSGRLLTGSRSALAAATYVAHHADGRLDALVVAGDLPELVVTERVIERAGRLVARAQLEPDDEGSRGERGLLEPPHQRPRDAAAAVGRIDGEQVEMRDILAIAHDREARDHRRLTCGEHDALCVPHVPADARCSPRRLEAGLDVRL